MTDQERAVMQQALEALYEETAWIHATPKGAAAITALRDALAQQPEPVQEPVAPAMRDAAVYGVGIFRDGKRIDPASIYAQPEPGQEPAAWNWMLDGRPYGQAYYGNPPDADIVERAAISGHTVRLLYAKPFRSKPLTDEEIAEATAQERDALLDHIYEYGTAAEGVLERIRKLCRAIERKVRGE